MENMRPFICTRCSQVDTRQELMLSFITIAQPMMGHMQALAQSKVGTGQIYKIMHRGPSDSNTREKGRKGLEMGEGGREGWRVARQVKDKKNQENVPEGCALFYKKKRWTLHNTQRATQQQEGSGYNCSYWKGQVRKSQTPGKECY